jgi:hypothetical protein
MELRTWSAAFGSDAYRLAEEALRGYGHFPGDSSATVSAEFPSSVKLWEQFEGAISKTHARDGPPWQRDSGASILPALRRRFLDELDDRLENVQPAAQELADRIQRLYGHPW